MTTSKTLTPAQIAAIQGRSYPNMGASTKKGIKAAKPRYPHMGTANKPAKPQYPNMGASAAKGIKAVKPLYPNMGAKKTQPISPAKRAKFFRDNTFSDHPPKWNGASTSDVYGKVGMSPGLMGNLNEQNRRNFADADREDAAARKRRRKTLAEGGK